MAQQQEQINRKDLAKKIKPKQDVDLTTPSGRKLPY